MRECIMSQIGADLYIVHAVMFSSSLTQVTWTHMLQDTSEAKFKVFMLGGPCSKMRDWILIAYHRSATLKIVCTGRAHQLNVPTGDSSTIAQHN